MPLPRLAFLSVRVLVLLLFSDDLSGGWPRFTMPPEITLITLSGGS